MELSRRRFIEAGATLLATMSAASTGTQGSVTPRVSRRALRGTPAVAVVGDGMAGVVAGELLRRAGARVTLFALASSPCEEVEAFAALPELSGVEPRSLERLRDEWGVALAPVDGATPPDAALPVDLLRPALVRMHAGLSRSRLHRARIVPGRRAIHVDDGSGSCAGFAAVVMAMPAQSMPRVADAACPRPCAPSPGSDGAVLRRLVRADLRWAASRGAWRDATVFASGDDAALLDALSVEEGQAFLRQMASRRLGVRPGEVEVLRQHSYLRQPWPADLGWHRPPSARPVAPPQWRSPDSRVVACGSMSTALEGPGGLIEAGAMAAKDVLALLG